jgi:hypothetical protein
MADRIYYHALYHLTIHWATLMATIWLLVTFGAALTLTDIHPSGTRRFYCILIVALLVLSSWLSLWRVQHYANLVNSMLPESYVRSLRTTLIPAPLIVLPAIVTLLVGALSLSGLFRTPKKRAKPELLDRPK